MPEPQCQWGIRTHHIDFSGANSWFCPDAVSLAFRAYTMIEDVSRFLDHSSLAVTTTYLRRLAGQEDRGVGAGGGGYRCGDGWL